MPAGTLNVTVVAGRDLKKTQYIGRQDPYVVVEAGSTQFTTKTDTDGGKKPKWNQKFEVSLGPDVSEIKLSVWNANVVHTNDLIGTGRLTLNTVFTQGFHDARIQLVTQEGKSAGELQLLLTFQAFVSTPLQPSLVAATPAEKPTGGDIIVQVLAGSGLKNVETAGQRQDPYCVAQIGSTRYRTKTVTDGGKNPKFDERFTFSVGPQDTQLTVELWDANVVRTDKMIGSGRVSLHEARSKTFHEVRVGITDAKGVTAGELELFITFKPFGGVIAQPATQSMVYPTMQPAIQPQVAGTVSGAPQLYAVSAPFTHQPTPAPQTLTPPATVVQHPQPVVVQTISLPVAAAQPAPVPPQPVSYPAPSAPLPMAAPQPVPIPQAPQHISYPAHSALVPMAAPQPVPQAPQPVSYPAPTYTPPVSCPPQAHPAPAHQAAHTHAPFYHTPMSAPALTHVSSSHYNSFSGYPSIDNIPNGDIFSASLYPVVPPSGSQSFSQPMAPPPFAVAPHPMGVDFGPPCC